MHFDDCQRIGLGFIFPLPPLSLLAGGKHRGEVGGWGAAVRRLRPVGSSKTLEGQRGLEGWFHAEGGGQVGGVRLLGAGVCPPSVSGKVPSLSPPIVSRKSQGK